MVISTPTLKTIPIVADDREGRGPVLAELRGMPEFDVTLARLPVGDYRVDDRFLFERKTLVDLVASVESGRLFAQALRMARMKALQPVLVLEGTSQDLEGSRMTWEAVQGALVTVALFVGLPMLRTRGAVETARTFLYAARQGRTHACGALPRRGRRPTGKVAVQNYILQGLPGVGPARAAQLLKRFGSVEAAIAAGPEALTALPGIGARTARAIRWAVEEKRAAYG
ncbi:MAG: ERCC4 domain-containing protein [Pseudomonadota bacterium]